MLEERLKEEELHAFFMRKYPPPDNKKISVFKPFYSFVPHATDKYVVSPKTNVVDLMFAYSIYKTITSFPNPFVVGFFLSIFPFWLYVHHISKRFLFHELSHAYRLRHKHLSKKETSRFKRFMEKLEVSSLNSRIGPLKRELTLMLYIPLILYGRLARNEQHLEEKLAREDEKA